MNKLEIKDELEPTKVINKTLQHENVILKETVASLQNQTTEAKASEYLKTIQQEMLSIETSNSMQGQRKYRATRCSIGQTNWFLTSQDQKSVYHTH